MTTDEVEVIVGRFHRPNLDDGRKHFAWIGEDGMLRAFFDAPDRTLSDAVLSVVEEDRTLDLGPDALRRVRQATIIQTRFCVPCRQRYQHPQSGRRMMCPACGNECDLASAGILVPSPGDEDPWNRFWSQYNTEKEQLSAFERGELKGQMHVNLFGLTLP
jgi:hypothetical protein